MALLLQIYFDCTAYVCLLHHFIVAVHCSHSLRVKWMDVCAKSNELESTSTEKKKKCATLRLYWHRSCNLFGARIHNDFSIYLQQFMYIFQFFGRIIICEHERAKRIEFLPVATAINCNMCVFNVHICLTAISWFRRQVGEQGTVEEKKLRQFWMLGDADHNAKRLCGWFIAWRQTSIQIKCTDKSISC